MTTLSAVIDLGTYSAIPAAGIAGRLYFATDTRHSYRDNGATWDDVTPSLLPTAEEVVFTGTAGTLAHTPLGIVMLYKNGQYLSALGGSPDYTIADDVDITLTIAATSEDEYVAIYPH